MKRLDKNFKLLVAITVVLGLSLSVMAQQHYTRQMPQRYMMAHSPMQLLDLTEDQKDQIKEIRLAHIKVVQPMKDEVKINRLKVDVLLKTADPDMKEIIGLVETNGKLLTQIQVKSIEQKINVRSLLTDEQKIIYDAQTERTDRRRAMALHYGHRKAAGRSRF